MTSQSEPSSPILPFFISVYSFIRFFFNSTLITRGVESVECSLVVFVCNVTRIPVLPYRLFSLSMSWLYFACTTLYLLSNECRLRHTTNVAAQRLCIQGDVANAIRYTSSCDVTAVLVAYYRTRRTVGFLTLVISALPPGSVRL